jgi:hypothetical protein
MPTTERVTPVPGYSEHVLTWDSYQDGRIRLALILSLFALVLAAIAFGLALPGRHPSEGTARPVVVPECPSLNIPACPSITIPACPPVPPCPQCLRPTNGNHSRRNP